MDNNCNWLFCTLMFLFDDRTIAHVFDKAGMKLEIVVIHVKASSSHRHTTRLFFPLFRHAYKSHAYAWMGKNWYMVCLYVLKLTTPCVGGRIKVTTYACMGSRIGESMMIRDILKPPIFLLLSKKGPKTFHLHLDTLNVTTFIGCPKS